MMLNAKRIYPHNTPTTKEAYHYRMIFERFFPQVIHSDHNLLSRYLQKYFLEIIYPVAFGSLIIKYPGGDESFWPFYMIWGCRTLQGWQSREVRVWLAAQPRPSSGTLSGRTTLIPLGGLLLVYMFLLMILKHPLLLQEKTLPRSPTRSQGWSK